MGRCRTDCMTRANTSRTNWEVLGTTIAFVSLKVLGCATVDPPPARSADTATLPAPAPTDARDRRVALAADLVRCETESPRFFYDVDVPWPQDRSELLSLANCLESEPYRELKLLLVGRADAASRFVSNEVGRARGQPGLSPTKGVVMRWVEGV